MTIVYARCSLKLFYGLLSKLFDKLKFQFSVKDIRIIAGRLQYVDA